MKTFSLENEFSQFVDREDETREILDDIRTSDTSKVAIIAANTAVGKSALVQKIYNELDDHRLKVRIKTSPENIGSNPNEWAYLEYIFNAVNNSCETSNYEQLTFEYFINHCKSKVVRKDVLNSLVDNIFQENNKISAIMIIIKLVLKRALKLDFFDPQTFEYNQSGKHHIIKSHYINYVLQSKDVILNIDNIQNIDYSSLNQMSKWIASNAFNSHYYLFEYTFSEKYTFVELQNLQNFFRDCGVLTTTYMLKKLPSEHIVDLVNKHVDTPIENMKFSITLVEFYKKDSTGNLKKLIDFSLNYEDNSNYVDCNGKDPTLNSLVRLSDESKYLIAVIIYCNARISLVELKEIAEKQYITSKKFVALLNELELKQIICQATDYAEIKHASIIDTWNNSSVFHKYNSLAYKDVELYLLNNINKQKNGFSRKWTQLLHLYSKSNPRKISTLLSYLKTTVIKDISPKKAWSYLSLLIEETKVHIMEFKKMYFEIIKICFEFELYNEGFYCICLLEEEIPLSKDYNLLLNKCMFLSALDRHMENIELCEYYMSRINAPSRAYLNLCLIIMASYRSTNQKEKCFNLYKEIQSEHEYKNYIEYGYFLRLTCMYMPRKTGIKFIRQSIKFFMRKHEYYQAGKSLISYSYALSSLKKYNKAYRSINKAEKLLENKQMGQHMFLVNKAAILLCKGIYNEFVWNLLDQAEISAVVPFDRLAIIVNKIVLCIENKNYSTMDLLINQAATLIDLEPDKHIHSLIYYNLYLYYKDIGDLDNAKKFYQKAYELRIWCESMKLRMTSETTRKPNHEWYNCFLEYWTYDLFQI